MTVCVIPARGGSKRIPHKNIKLFHGKPLIAYSLECALESQLFDRVIVSTDDDDIAETAQAFGAEIPFKRPAELSDDHANTFDLLAHSAHWVQTHVPNCDLMCCLYATAPFVQIQDLKQAFSQLKADAQTDYVYSITEFGFPIQRSIRQVDGYVRPCFPDNTLKRSQDLEPIFHDAGQFYFGRVSAFAERRDFFGNHSRGVVLPRYRVVDIDTPDDWDVAEVQYTVLKNLGKLT